MNELVPLFEMAGVLAFVAMGDIYLEAREVFDDKCSQRCITFHCHRTCHIRNDVAKRVIMLTRFDIQQRSGIREAEWIPACAGMTSGSGCRPRCLHCGIPDSIRHTVRYLYSVSRRQCYIKDECFN